MDEKLKIAGIIASSVGGLLVFIIGLLNLFPTRTSARVVENRLEFDKETQKDKRTEEEYNKIRADRDYWEKRTKEIEKDNTELRNKLFKCEDDFHELKNTTQWKGTERRTEQRAYIKNESDP